MHERGASDRPDVRRADFGRRSLRGVHVGTVNRLSRARSAARQGFVTADGENSISERRFSRTQAVDQERAHGMARKQGDRQALGFGGSTATATPTAVSDDREGGEVQTRATYRFLLMRGLNPTEAANLTAYLCGIEVDGSHWSIGEVNRLLFLRRLARSGRWSASEDAASRQDGPAQAA
jgi:hypothetical protein